MAVMKHRLDVAIHPVETVTPLLPQSVGLLRRLAHLSQASGLTDLDAETLSPVRSQSVSSSLTPNSPAACRRPP
jgi:hypothetical protein